MFQLPSQLIAHYTAHLNERGIPVARHAEYRQWLRYYLDFCEKYQVTGLLQANYDIRVIQKLLGHVSLKTTMIYTHCVPVRTVKEPKSPLDF